MFAVRSPSAARLRRPVVSIGNLALGGRGKTPLVAHVARMLVDAGERPAILSRGYGRRRVEEGAVIVSDGTRCLADLDRAGDEPLLLARRVPGAAVIVCDQRAIAGALAERVLDVTVHLLDDGFQHRALARDVDIVLMAPGDFDDRRLPLGRLREPVSALRRADAIVIDGLAGGEEARGSRGDAPGVPPRTRVFSLARALGDPVPLEPDRSWPGIDPGVVAVAGIAGPSRFVRALEGRGWRVAYAMEFPDHHTYTRGDVGRIADAVARWGASAVLTTEKDAMRLLPHRPLPVPVAAVPLEVEVGAAAEFRAWLMTELARARS